MVKAKAPMGINAPDVNGTRLSEEAVQSLAEEAPGTPVTLGFNLLQAVGIVDGVQLSERGVEAEVEIDSSSLIGLYLVPNFVVESFTMQGSVKVFDRISLLTCSLTTHPSDPHLTTVKVDFKR